jgi:hypothetical protein
MTGTPHKPFKTVSATNRARLSNCADLLPGVTDGRSARARRFRDLVGNIVSDSGGPDRMAEARLQLIRRFSAASVLAEGLESRLVNGEQIDVGEHATLCSTLVRLAGRIGIDRRARNVTPTLQDYLADKAEIEQPERAIDPRGLGGRAERPPNEPEEIEG